MAQKPNKKGKPLGSMSGEGFFAMHPFESVFFDTDRYYNDIVKKVFSMLQHMRVGEIDERILRRMALCVTAYFEDQVSELGLWQAFIHRHRQLYGRWLPWYDTSEDYYEDEVNLQDVKFLLWLINVSTDIEEFTAPDDPRIEECGQAIFDFLVEEFENAPINEDLVRLIYSPKITEDFYTLKKVLMWMTKTCYLMAVPAWQQSQRDYIRDAVGKLGETNDYEKISYFTSSYVSLRMRVGPLALYTKEWLVLMRQFKGITEDNDKIMAIESTPFYPFMIVSNNGDTITMRSCRGVDYDVAIDSFGENVVRRMKPGQMLFTALAYYHGKWGINGISVFYGTSDKTDSEEALKDLGKQLQKNGQPIDLFDIQDTSVPPAMPLEMKERLDKAIVQNHDSRLFYFPNAQSAIDWQTSEIFQKPIGGNPVSDFGNQADEPVMMYAGTNYSLFLSSMAYTVNDPSNPYYDPERSYMGTQWLYTKFGIPDELVAYLVKHNYLADLSFIDGEQQLDYYADLIADNLPFWATFMRQYPC